MTNHSARILRVAYNNAHRKILKLHMRCSASQMFADNNLLNFEALMRKMFNTFISHLISSDNAIIKVILDNMVAREREKVGILVQYIILECLSPVLDILC